MGENQRARMNTAEFLNSVPPGYRFDPTDEELIDKYLVKKINEKNREVPSYFSRIVNDVQLYSSDPQQLSEKYETVTEGIWYFFTPRNKKYLNGHRPDRGTPGGYWKATGADVPIHIEGRTVGFKNTLVFYEGAQKPPGGKKTKWIMKEYRIRKTGDKTRPGMKLDDWVLCKIYKNKEKSAANATQVANTEARNQISEERPTDNTNRAIPVQEINQGPALIPQIHTAQNNSLGAYNNYINFLNMPTVNNHQLLMGPYPMEPPAQYWMDDGLPGDLFDEPKFYE